MKPLSPSTASLLASCAKHEVTEWYSKVYLPSGVRFSNISGEVSYLCRLVERHVLAPPGVTKHRQPTSDEVEAAVKEALADHAAKALEAMP